MLHYIEKAVVRQHQRKSKTGKLGTVKQYDREAGAKSYTISVYADGDKEHSHRMSAEEVRQWIKKNPKEVFSVTRWDGNYGDEVTHEFKLEKASVRAYQRRTKSGNTVQVRSYQNKRTAAPSHTVNVIRERQKLLRRKRRHKARQGGKFISSDKARAIAALKKRERMYRKNKPEKNLRHFVRAHPKTDAQKKHDSAKWTWSKHVNESGTTTYTYKRVA